MTPGKRRALRFVLLVGALSLFADFVYEGARSIAGPFLAVLGASGAVVGVASGFGELVGYALRLPAGRLADRTGRTWPLAILGYVIQMAAVPALALAGNWEAAVGLLVLERCGKAVRNPAMKSMLSHAGHELGGYGWTFGLHEALDQTGALLGPLAMAAILWWKHELRLAFAVLAIPAAANLLLVGAARLLYPRPHELEPAHAPPAAAHPPRALWIAVAGTALVGAGFADYPLIAFHFQKSSVVPQSWIPVFYAAAMGTAGLSSLVFGKLYDRVGLKVLVPATLAYAAYAPLAFLGGRWVALAGAALWGVGLGVQESVLSAVVAQAIARERRASVYGQVQAAYGVAWFLGSSLLGVLYDVSLGAVVGAALALELAAIPVFAVAARRLPPRPA